jgi:hypothetical protein
MNMVLTFDRLKKIVPIILLIMLVLTVFAYWKDIRSAVFRRIPILGLVFQYDAKDEEKSQSDGDSKLETGTVKIISGTEEFEISIEKAQTASEIEQGLMYREELCENCGMMFYFESDRFGGFWMKNCKIPLDMLFLATDGEILDIKKNFEPCEADPCPSYVPAMAYRYVLELNGWWAEKNEVAIGDRVEGIE